LIRHILASESAGGQPVEIDEEAMLLLENYAWPGNVRQLRNALRAALALRDGARIMPRDLPEEITFAGRTLPADAGVARHAGDGSRSLNPLESAERAALLEGLARQRWKITNLARELQVSRNTLYRKMKRLDIKDPSK
jgi:transcriptional regulator of acetoin/glycerol metabolism